MLTNTNIEKDTKQITAVIVEDEVIIAEDLKEILEELGYHVPDTAVSAEEAIDLIRNEKPDIVLVDIMLKGRMDGIELAKIINDSFDIPFIFVTSHADRATIERAKKTRPHGYIVKPFEEEDIFAAVEIAMNNFANEKDQLSENDMDNLTIDGIEITGEGMPRYRLRLVSEFVNNNIDKTLTLNELSGVVGMSPYYFSRLFKKATGYTPHQYVIKARIERAKKMLRDSNLPIAQISMEVGYESQSHFTMVFKRLTGLTPAEFMRRAQA